MELNARVWTLVFVKRFFLEHGRFDKTVMVAATESQKEKVINIASEYGYELDSETTELTHQGFADQIAERDYSVFFAEVAKR